MEAVTWQNHEALDLLFSWGADPYLRESRFRSAIGKAVEIGDQGVMGKPVDPRTLQYRAEMMNKLMWSSKLDVDVTLNSIRPELLRQNMYPKLA